MKKTTSKSFKVNNKNEIEVTVTTKYTLSASEAIFKLTGLMNESGVKEVSLDDTELKIENAKQITPGNICYHPNATKEVNLYFKTQEDRDNCIVTCPTCGKRIKVMKLTSELVTLNFFSYIELDNILDNLFIYYSYKLYGEKDLNKLLKIKNNLEKKKDLSLEEKKFILDVYNYVTEIVIDYNILMIIDAHYK